MVVRERQGASERRKSLIMHQASHIDGSDFRGQRNLLRVLKAVAVAWLVVSVLLLWLATKAKSPRDAPSVSATEVVKRSPDVAGRGLCGSIGQVLTVTKRL